MVGDWQKKILDLMQVIYKLVVKNYLMEPGKLMVIKDGLVMLIKILCVFLLGIKILKMSKVLLYF